MTRTLARDLVNDPDWIPHTFTADGGHLTFVHVPRGRRDALMFLSEEHFGGAFEKATVPFAEIGAEASSVQTAPIHFIFHTAFCASTLLVRALDTSGAAIGLKEPDALINLANRFVRSDDDSNRRRLALVLGLLARSYAPDEAVVVKPTNFANRLLLPAMEARPGAKAVLLHSDLPTFLRSLAKRGMWGRIWARKLYRGISAWAGIDTGFDAGEIFELTDLQIAGLAWLMQVSHFDRAKRELGDRAMILDSADFLADPATHLQSVARHFDIALDKASADTIAGGDVFSRHSKFAQRDYSVEAREAEHDAVVAAHGEEIDMVVKWVEAVAAHCRVPMRPGDRR